MPLGTDFGRVQKSPQRFHWRRVYEAVDCVSRAGSGHRLPTSVALLWNHERDCGTFTRLRRNRWRGLRQPLHFGSRRLPALEFDECGFLP